MDSYHMPIRSFKTRIVGPKRVHGQGHMPKVTSLCQAGGSRCSGWPPLSGSCFHSWQKSWGQVAWTVVTMPTHAFLPPAGHGPKWLSHMQSSLAASNTDMFMVAVEMRSLRHGAVPSVPTVVDLAGMENRVPHHTILCVSQCTSL